MGQASRDNYDALFRTLVFCFFVTTIQFTLGLILALVVNQGLKGTNFFRTLYFMPVILGAVIQVLIWSLFLYTSSWFLNAVSLMFIVCAFPNWPSFY